MRRALAVPLVLLSLLLAPGCGDDEDDGGGGGDGGTPSAQTAPTETTQPEATEPKGEEPTPVDKGSLTSCLADADLELKPGDEPFTDVKGKTKTRQDMNLETAAYLGYVQWPSKRVADIYLAEDEAAAEKAEQEAGLFVKAFGFEPEKYVRRSGLVLMTFDDPPPSDGEIAAVEGCA